MKKKILLIAACGTLAISMSACGATASNAQGTQTTEFNIATETASVSESVADKNVSNELLTTTQTSNDKFEFIALERDTRKILKQASTTVPEDSELVEDNQLGTKDENKSYSPSLSGDGAYNTWDPYVGKFSIPGVGLSVNCYNSASQATVDAANSAAYFYLQGHLVVADHVNQGFNKIKSCKEGTIAYVPYGSGTVEYECVAVINGINTGYGLKTADGRDISELYPGSVVCYTCNGNWQNVTIVFFQLPGGETPEEFEDGGAEFYPSEENSNICPAGKHKWELEDSFQYIDITDTHRIKYNQDHYVCSKCGSDYLTTQELNRWPIEDEDWWVNEYGDKVTDPEPIDPPDETPTEPPVQETEPPVEEPAPLPEGTTPPTEPSTELPQEESPVVETTPPTEPPVIVPEPEPDPDPELIVDPTVSEQEE